MKSAIANLQARRVAALALFLLIALTGRADQNSIPCSADDFNFSLYDAIDGKTEGGYNGLGSFKNNFTVTYTINNTVRQAYTVRFAYKGGHSATTIDFTFTDQDFNEVKASKTVQVVSDWAYTEVDVPELPEGELTMVMKFSIPSGTWCCNMKEMSFSAQSTEKYVELPAQSFDLTRYTENQTQQAEDQRTSTALTSFKNKAYVTYLLNNTMAAKYLMAFEAGTVRDDASVDIVLSDKETGERVDSQNVVIANTGDWNKTKLYLAELPQMEVGKYVLKLVFNSSETNWTANLYNLQFKDALSLTPMEAGTIALGAPWTTKGTIKCATIIDSTRDGAQAHYLLKNDSDGAGYEITAETATPNAGVTIVLSMLTLAGDTLATDTFECETCANWTDYRKLKLEVESVPSGFCLLAIDIKKADGQWCANIGSIAIAQKGTAVFVDLPSDQFDLTRYTENQTQQAEDQRTATKLESFKNGAYVTYLLNNTEEKSYLAYFEASTDRDDAAVNVTIKNLDTEAELVNKDLTITNTGSWNAWQGYLDQLPTMAVGQYELKITFKSSETNWTANMQNVRFADSALINEVADSSEVMLGLPWATSGTIKCATIIDSDRNGAKATYLVNNAATAANYNLVVKAATPNDGVQLKASLLTLNGDTLSTDTLDVVKGSDWNTTQDLTYALGQVPSGYSFVTFDIIKNDNNWAVNIHNVMFAKPVEVVLPDTVVLTVKNMTRTYGEANPEWEYEVTRGTFEGVTVLGCEAADTSSVGEYVISLTLEEPAGHIIVVPGKLTITKALLTVTAVDTTKEEGQDNPDFTIVYSGFKNDETAEVLTVQPTATTVATKDSKAGEYAITVAGGEAVNYNFEYVGATLTITASTAVSAAAIGAEPVDVFDASGRCILRQTTSLAGLPRGVYMLSSGKKVVVK